MKTTYKITGKILTILFGFGMLFHLNMYANGIDKMEATSSSNLVAIEMENEIIVEDWMIDLNLWSDGQVEKDVAEEELSIEDWMTDASLKHWVSSESNNVNESEIVVENWMTDLEQW